jgi:hypothetical protein
VTVPYPPPDGLELACTRVVDCDVAHLAFVEGELGELLRAICRPANARPLDLELVPQGAPLVWCPDCRAYAARIGQTLPGRRRSGGGESAR